MANQDAGGSLSITCPAKLNLTLAVGAPRADGLHPIASVMVTVRFGDELILTPSKKETSRFTRTWHGDAPRPTPIDWPIESDLIYRAHALMEQAAGRPLPVEAALTKRIPAGAGLGGGSSNAAAMLIGLNRLFDLAIDERHLLDLAQGLGADVVFLVRAMLDQPAALVTGIGEVIEPINSLPAFDALLIFPDGACPTGEVYADFDRASEAARSDSELAEFAMGWLAGSGLPNPMNDLANSAATTCPPIEQTIQTLAALGVQAHVTGSGSALFAMMESQQQAVAIANSLANHGLIAYPTSYAPYRNQAIPI
jgi:4-diphosphocytidyl-2-C-methyl-D-erythritol kinase